MERKWTKRKWNWFRYTLRQEDERTAKMERRGGGEVDT